MGQLRADASWSTLPGQLVILGQKQVLQVVVRIKRRLEDGGRMEEKVMKIWKGQDGRGGLEAEVPESKPAGFPRLQSTNIRDGIDEYPMGARAVLVLPEL